MSIPEATQENKTAYTNKGLGERGGGGNLWFRIPALVWDEGCGRDQAAWEVKLPV